MLLGNGSANLDSWGRVVMTGFERAQDTLCTGNDALNDEIAFIQWDIDNYLRDAYHSKDDKDKVLSPYGANCDDHDKATFNFSPLM